MSLRAGVAMVYRNIRGEYTNNGHAVVVLKLPDGRDIIVDASDPEPFARHKGLFVREKDYLYVEPIYARDSDAILAYKASSGKGNIATSRVRTLDFAFINSQFWYYRGERAPGGLFSGTRTKEGLRASEIALQMSVRLNPGNPLAVFMLGRVLLAEGDTKQAKSCLDKAIELYSRYGWIPEGPKQFYSNMK
jgi:tetratricopeptide (TPR) repeat protein